MNVSPPPMMRGGGGPTGAEASAWETAGFTLETWNMGWIRLIVVGSLSQTAVGLRTCVMVKGPTYRGASLRVPPRMGMSFVESHTRCPTQ